MRRPGLLIVLAPDEVMLRKERLHVIEDLKRIRKRHKLCGYSAWVTYLDPLDRDTSASRPSSEMLCEGLLHDRFEAMLAWGTRLSGELLKILNAVPPDLEIINCAWEKSPLDEHLTKVFRAPNMTLETMLAQAETA